MEKAKKCFSRASLENPHAPDLLQPAYVFLEMDDGA